MPQLQDILSQEAVETIPFGEIRKENGSDFDLVILSGSSNYSVIQDNEQFCTELELIRDSQKPVLGICLGFELLGYLYGADFAELDRKEKGILDIQATAEQPIFHEPHHYDVFEYHRWVITTVPGPLKELASSKDGVEAVVHHQRPVYGFQFHPEMFVHNSDGHKIFSRLMDRLKEK